MQSIERAIRNALSKGDLADQAFRKKVYASALSAVERSARERGLGDGDIAARRAQVSSVIVEVERGIMLDLKAAAVRPSVPFAPDDRHVRHTAEELAPLETVVQKPLPLRADGRPERRAEELERLEAAAEAARHGRPVPPPAPPVRDDDDTPVRVRTPWSLLLVTVLAIVGLGMFAVWLFAAGIIGPTDPDTGPVPNPRNDVEDNFTPAPPPRLGEEQAADTRDWVDIFVAGNAGGLDVPAGVTADIVNQGGVAGLRIAVAGQGGEIGIPVGAGVLERFAGKTVLFDIIARSGREGAMIAVAARCDFGAGIECQRRRYDVGYEYGDLLYTVDLPAGAGGAGVIRLSPEPGDDNAVIVERVRATLAD